MLSSKPNNLIHKRSRIQSTDVELDADPRNRSHSPHIRSSSQTLAIAMESLDRRTTESKRIIDSDDKDKDLTPLMVPLTSSKSLPMERLMSNHQNRSEIGFMLDRPASNDDNKQQQQRQKKTKKNKKKNGAPIELQMHHLQTAIDSKLSISSTCTVDETEDLSDVAPVSSLDRRQTWAGILEGFGGDDAFQVDVNQAWRATRNNEKSPAPTSATSATSPSSFPLLQNSKINKCEQAQLIQSSLQRSSSESAQQKICPSPPRNVSPSRSISPKNTTSSWTNILFFSKEPEDNSNGLDVNAEFRRMREQVPDLSNVDDIEAEYLKIKQNSKRDAKLQAKKKKDSISKVTKSNRQSSENETKQEENRQNDQVPNYGDTTKSNLEYHDDYDPHFEERDTTELPANWEESHEVMYLIA